MIFWVGMVYTRTYVLKFWELYLHTSVLLVNGSSHMFLVLLGEAVVHH